MKKKFTEAQIVFALGKGQVICLGDRSRVDQVAEASRGGGKGFE